MSNYLLLLARGSQRENIRAWVSRHQTDLGEEVFVADVGSGVELTFVARLAQLDRVAGQSRLFRGYLIDHEAESIVMGARGYKERSERLGESPARLGRQEGCYIEAVWDEASVSVGRDLFGLMPMLYTSANDLVAISDSILVLSKLRGDLGLGRSLSRTTAIARAWSNTMAGQLLSENTIIREISYAPYNTTITLASQTFRLGVHRDQHSTLFPASDDDYATALFDGAVRLTGVLSGMATGTPGGLRLALSGGLDSRVCLAAALMSPVGVDNMEFSSANRTPSQKRDYQIVRALAEQENFPLGVRGSGARPLPEVGGQLGWWALANLGLYDFLAMPGPSPTGDSPLAIGGHGAEFLKGAFGWRPLRSISRLIPDKRIASAFLEQASDGLAVFDVDPTDRTASEWHYRGYRNPIHSGRFVQTSLFGMRPLLSSRLVAVAEHHANPAPRPRKKAFNVVSDLLIVLSPSLAAAGFEDDLKNIPGDQIAERRAALGRGVTADDVSPYEMLGDALAVQQGHSTLLLRAARLAVPELEDEAARTELVAELYKELLDRELKEVYKPYYDTVVAASVKGVRLSSVGSAFGKLLQFILLKI